MRLRAHARRWRSHHWWPSLAALGAAATGVTAAAPAAHAQAFGLNEIGSCAIARGFAVTSTPCNDASSLFWNPGAVNNLPVGVSAYVGTTAIGVKGKFTADVTGRQYNSNVPTAIPPYVGLAVRPANAPRLMVGLATYVPYGLTSQWNSDFPGKFSAQKAALQNFYIQPTAAYELVPGRLSIGAGAILAVSTIEIRQSLDFSQSPLPGGPPGATLATIGIQPGTEFATARVNGNGVGGGYTLGLHARPIPTVQIGARYLSKVTVHYDKATANFYTSPAADSVIFGAGNPFGAPAGTSLQQIVAAQFQPGVFAGQGTLQPGQTASTVITNPAQIQAGIGYTGLPNTTLSVDYAQIRWSSFQSLPVNFYLPGGTPNAALSRVQAEGYKNSSAVRAGLEHRFGGDAGIAGRLGFAYAQTPAPDSTVTPLLPDMDRYNFGGGLGIPLGRYVGERFAKYALDASYLRVETKGRRGRTVNVNNGFYNLNANVFSASIRAAF